MYNFKLYPQKHSSQKTVPSIKVIDYSSKTVSLFTQPYLDKINQCYKNIVVINMRPQGPLAEYVKIMKFPPLSEFKQKSNKKECGLYLLSFYDNDKMMEVDEVPNLISYLVSNGYTVDTSITKMFNSSDISFDTEQGKKLICFITYND